MGYLWCVFELHIVLQAPATDVVAILLIKRTKATKIVNPLLDGNKARAVEAFSFTGREGSADGIVALGVFRSVFLTREITASLVAKAVDPA